MRVNDRWKRLSAAVLCWTACGLLAFLALGCGGARSEQRRAEGDAYLEAGRVEDARDAYELALMADAANARAHLGMARALLAQGDAAEAIEAARKACTLDPSIERAYQFAAEALLQEGRFDEALQTARTLASINAEAGAALRTLVQRERERLAEALVASQEAHLTEAPPQGASTTVADDQTSSSPLVPPGSEDWRTLWTQASFARLLDRREEIISAGSPHALETVVMAAALTHNVDLARDLSARLPDDSPLRAYVAALNQPDLEAVLAVFEGWDPTDSDMQLIRQAALGFALGLAGARDHALRVLSEMQARWPENAVPSMIIADLFRAAGMPQYSAAALRTVVDRYPDNLDAHRTLFRTLRDCGMADQARAAAEAAYARFPDEPSAVLNLAQSLLDADELGRAGEILAEAQAARPDEPVFRLAAARVALEAGDCAQADDLLGDQPPGADHAAQWALHKALGAALVDDWTGVEAICHRVPEGDGSAVLHLLHAAALTGRRETEQAIALLSDASSGAALYGPPSALALRAMGREAGNLTPDQTAFAELLAGDAELLRAFLKASALQIASLHDAAYAVFGEIWEALDKPAALLPYLLTSLAEARTIDDRCAEARSLVTPLSDVPAAWMALSSLLEMEGDVAGARDAMLRVTELDADNAVAWFRLGQLREREDVLVEAVAAYRKADELDPESAAVNNNLAYCLLQTDGDVAEALRRAEAASAMLPGNPQVLHTLGVAQRRTGDLAAARRSFSLALQTRPGDPTLLLDLGLLLIETGQVEEGRMQIETALEYAELLDLPFSRRAEAEQALGG